MLSVNLRVVLYFHAPFAFVLCLFVIVNFMGRWEIEKRYGRHTKENVKVNQKRQKTHKCRFAINN